MTRKAPQPAAGLRSAPRLRNRAVASLSLGAALAGLIMPVVLWSISFDAAFMLALPFLALWALAALTVFVFALITALRRRWRRALSLSAFPLVAMAAFLNFGYLWQHAIDFGETIHFFAYRSTYLAEAAKLPASPAPRLASFNSGEFIAADSVAYDESDEIDRPEGQESEAWKKRIKGTELECGAWGVPMGGHFYIVRMGC